MTNDITVWTQSDVNKIWNICACANTKSTGLKFCRVDVLQERNILIVVMMSPERFDSSYDVTRAAYFLSDLYLPKMKTALFVAPEFNRLSRACAL